MIDVGCMLRYTPGSVTQQLRIALLVLLTSASAHPRTEISEINGARFRIDVPEHWNRTLIVYCHPYSMTPAKFSPAEALEPELQVLVDANYALIQSGYAATGWAVQNAAVDIESLRRYFLNKYGAVSHTYIMGPSMGGFLTMMLLETSPTVYDGGLSMCASLVSSLQLFTYWFDAEVLFSTYFPGHLPSPAKVPHDFKPSQEKDAELERALEAKPVEAEKLRRFLVMRTNRDLASTIDFICYVMKDFQEKAGGNPFDNRNTVYAITGSDLELNQSVSRYSADSSAVEYLRAYYTPSGRLVRPLLHLHTSYDPLVPAANPNSYTIRASLAGNASLYVQQYVKEEGHCEFSPAETLEGIRELTAWSENGDRPNPGFLSTRSISR